MVVLSKLGSYKLKSPCRYSTHFPAIPAFDCSRMTDWKLLKKTSWQLALGSKPGDAWQSPRWCYDQALKDAARFYSSVNQSKLHWREFLPKGLRGNTLFSYNEVSPGFTSAGRMLAHQCVKEKWTNPFDFGVVSPIAFPGRVKLAK